MANSVYKVPMDTNSSWLSAPIDAFRIWQETEAVGADRRPFSARSRVQHVTMFDRFLRHILVNRATVATFDATHIEAFFNDVERRVAPGTSTRLRYAKLLNRLCRHLIDAGIRTDNPAAAFAAFAQWPEDEPQPLFIDPASDERLQLWTVPTAMDDWRMVRNRAIVALLLGTGLSAAEIRQTRTAHLSLDGVRPNVYVPKRGARESRRLTVPTFALNSLLRWTEAQSVSNDTLLFPAPGRSESMNDVLLGTIVADALKAIDFKAADMSPRILRNTFARRQLLMGMTNEETSRMLGLISQRTVIRLRSTIDVATAP
jgi:integrase